MSEEKKQESGNLPQPKLDTELVKKFLEIQQQEILTRQGELAIKGKDIDNQKEVALKSIEAQKGDLSEQRHHRFKSNILTKGFVIIIALIVIGLIVYLIEKGKDSIAIEILKIVGIALLSFGGGFFYGKSRGQKDSPNELPLTD